MTGLIQLLIQARTAGLQLDRDGNRLTVRGPRTAAPLVQAILARKREALAYVDLYNGRAAAVDWGGEYRAAVANWESGSRDLPPCVLCERPALLRDPHDNLPMHKTCVECALIQPAVKGIAA